MPDSPFRPLTVVQENLPKQPLKRSECMLTPCVSNRRWGPQSLCHGGLGAQNTLGMCLEFIYRRREDLTVLQDDVSIATGDISAIEAKLSRTRECLSNTEKHAKDVAAKCYAVKLKYESACRRLDQLKSGKGPLLSKIGPASVYEFWLDVPGYSGSIKGVTARLTQHGDLQQVSEVKGTTKGGLGGAVIGGILLGPVGAVVGAVASRKSTVTTDIHTVDNRQFELEVVGQGFAWSTIKQGAQYLSSFQQFRDYINSRRSRDEDIQDAITTQQDIVESSRIALDDAIEVEREALATSAEALASYNTLLEEHATHNSQSQSGGLALLKAWFCGQK